MTPAYAGQAHVPMFLSGRVHPSRHAGQPSGGQLAAGVRAGPGTVGYLGSPAALTVLNEGDSLTAVNALGWNAQWDGALVINGNGVTIDHYRINSILWLAGTNPTVTSCIVAPPINSAFGIQHPREDTSLMTVTDTTFIGNPAGTSGYVGSGIASDCRLRAIRCDVSGSGDGIHALMATTSDADSLISQCCIHDQDFSDESQHCDGIQIFNQNAGNGFGYCRVEHTHVGRTTSDIGTPMSSALTCGGETTASLDNGTMTINNCYFQSGLIHLRLNNYLRNSVVTNNDLGPVYPSEFGTHGVNEPGFLATWSNNRDSTGTPVSP